MAVDRDHPPREPGAAEPVRAEGRRAPGVVRVDGVDHDALWFRHLRPQDRVSVKPHASPVLHAINYLLGELDPPYLTRLRDFGGLQSYPSRIKDPDPVDYSTGSVGIGATAPIWGALSRRYVDSLAAAPVPAGSTRWSATPNWTRARYGRPCSTRVSANWARSSGWST